MPLLNLAELQAETLSFKSPWSGVRDDSQTLDLRSVVHRHLHFVLDLNRGNKLKTARQLGISRSTLYRMLEEELTSSR